MNKTLLAIACCALLTVAVDADAAAEKMPMPTSEQATMKDKLLNRLKLSPEQHSFILQRRQADRIKLKDLANQIQEIRIQMKEIKKANVAAFESILTAEQKAEFAKIKAEEKARYLKRKKMWLENAGIVTQDIQPAVAEKAEAFNPSFSQEAEADAADNAPLKAVVTAQDKVSASLAEDQPQTENDALQTAQETEHREADEADLQNMTDDDGVDEVRTISHMPEVQLTK